MELPGVAEAGYPPSRNKLKPQLSAQFLKLLRKSEMERKKLLIQITAKEFSVPWDLIYPRTLHDQPSYEEFWGMRRIVCRNVEPNFREGAARGPVIPTNTPTAGFL